jgi:hypothetical protein
MSNCLLPINILENVAGLLILQLLERQALIRRGGLGISIASKLVLIWLLLIMDL